MNERSEEAIRLLSEASLNEEQAQELLGEFENNPETLSKASRLHQVHQLLSAHAATEKLCERVMSSLSQKENQQVENRVMQKIRSMPTPLETQIERRSFPMRRALALAASFALVFGAWLWWGMRENGEIVAKVLEASGESGLKVGDAIMAGAFIQTGKDGRIKLVYRDGVAEVVLGKNSKLLTIKSEKKLRLENGKFTAKVSKQPKDKPFVVTTPHAEMRVIGTQFTVLTNKKSTQLKVNEGEVSLRGGHNGVVSVKAGFIAVAAEGVPINPVPVLMDSAQNLPEGVVFFRDFETILPDEKSSNELVVLKEPEGEVTAMVSEPTDQGSPTFRPDVVLKLSRPSNALYIIPSDVEIRLRMKSERPGKWGISQSPTHQRFKVEHFFAGGFDVDNEWREFVVNSRDIKPYMNEGPSRDFVPGVEIGGFRIFGYGTGRIYLDWFTVISVTP